VRIRRDAADIRVLEAIETGVEPFDMAFLEMPPERRSR
jgi:hypothetical protein